MLYGGIRIKRRLYLGYAHWGHGASHPRNLEYARPDWAFWRDYAREKEDTTMTKVKRLLKMKSAPPALGDQTNVITTSEEWQEANEIAIEAAQNGTVAIFVGGPLDGLTTKLPPATATHPGEHVPLLATTVFVAEDLEAADPPRWVTSATWQTMEHYLTTPMAMKVDMRLLWVYHLKTLTEEAAERAAKFPKFGPAVHGTPPPPLGRGVSGAARVTARLMAIPLSHYFCKAVGILHDGTISWADPDDKEFRATIEHMDLKGRHPDEILAHITSLTPTWAQINDEIKQANEEARKANL